MKIKGGGGANFSCVNIYILAFFLQRSWDIALGPLKQIPMNFFIMWMAGNSISIFPIMMVGMMFFKPIQAFISVQNSKWYWQFPSSNIKSVEKCYYDWSTCRYVAVILKPSYFTFLLGMHPEILKFIKIRDSYITTASNHDL